MHLSLIKPVSTHARLITDYGTRTEVEIDPDGQARERQPDQPNNQNTPAPNQNTPPPNKVTTSPLGAGSSSHSITVTPLSGPSSVPTSSPISSASPSVVPDGNYIIIPKSNSVCLWVYVVISEHKVSYLVITNAILQLYPHANYILHRTLKITP